MQESYCFVLTLFRIARTAASSSSRNIFSSFHGVGSDLQSLSQEIPTIRYSLYYLNTLELHRVHNNPA